MTDAFVTVAVVHTLAHTWWAAWHAFLSAMHVPGPLAYLLGCTLCFFIIMLNEAIKAGSRALENPGFTLPRLIYEDFYHIFATMSLITMRRGTSYWIKFARHALRRVGPLRWFMKTLPLHLLAFGFLCAVGVSLSLGGMGGGVDGAAGDGDDIVCKVKYFDLKPPEEAGAAPAEAAGGAAAAGAGQENKKEK